MSAKKSTAEIGEPGKYGTVGTKVELYKRLVMAGGLTDEEIAARIDKGTVAFVRMYRAKLKAAGLNPPDPKE